MTKTLQTINNEFLADHKIGDNSVMPTVCAIAWMADAAETVYGNYRYVGLENYKLFKGIVFDGTEASDYYIDLNLVDYNKSSLALDVKISSNNAKGKPVFHYAAKVLLTSKSDEASLTTVELDHLLKATKAEKANGLYHDGTLFHGESLQGIDEIINCDNDGLLLRCQVPTIAATKQGEFPLSQNNIFANDLVYQAMLVWVRKQLGMGSLPSSTLSWTVYRQVRANETFYLKLDVVEKSSSKLIADISLISSDNKLLADIKSAEVTASENLNDLFIHSSAKVSGL